MSFNAVLEIGSKKHRLLSCDFALSRSTDNIGRPVSLWNGGTINMSVEATDDASLMEWVIKPADHKDGKIAFQKIEEESKMVELEWKNGYIVAYSVSYGEGSAMIINFTVSAEELHYGGKAHKNPWPKGGGAK